MCVCACACFSRCFPPQAGAEVARPTRRVSALARRGSAGFYVRNFMTGATCTDTQCPIKDLRLYGFPNISVLHRLISSCLGVHQLEEK